MLAFAVAIAAACAEAPEPSTAADQSQTDSRSESAATVTQDPDAQVVETLGLRNAALPFASNDATSSASGPMLITAAQPSASQMDALAAAGFEHFISLRDAGEDGAGWEEQHSAEAGVSFHRIPVRGASGLTRENVEALAELIDATEGSPTVLYCASSNRVGALLALKAYWLDGATPEDAYALGESAGMRGLSEPVRDMLGLEAMP